MNWLGTERAASAALGSDFAPRLDPLGGPHYSDDNEIDPAVSISKVTGVRS